MNVLDDIRAAVTFLKDLPCRQVDLHFPVVLGADFYHSLVWSDIETIDVGPVSDVGEFGFLRRVKHVVESASWNGLTGFLRWWLNPITVLLELQQQSGCNDD